MRKKSLWKDSFRTIWKTFPRFLALLLIIALGSGFFVGLRATRPGMIDLAADYYEEQNFQDIHIQSTYGIRDKDLEILDKVSGISYTPYRTVDRQDADNAVIYRFYPDFNAISQMNQNLVIEGRLPENTDEVAVDYNVVISGLEGYTIGDKVNLNDLGVAKDSQSDDTAKKEAADKIPHLCQDSFTIVGYVRSPLFVDRMYRGATNIGKGSIDYLCVVSPDAIEGDYFSAIAVEVKDAHGLKAYSPEYETVVEDKMAEIKEAFKGRDEMLFTEVKDDADKEIADGEKDINQAKQDIKDGEKEIADGKKKLNDAQAEIQDNEKKLEDGQKALDDAKAQIEEKLPDGMTLTAAIQELKDAQAKIDQGRKDYQAGLAQFNEEKAKAEKELADGRAKLKQAQAQLAEGEKELADGKAKLQAAFDELAAKENELNQGQEELNKAKANFAQKKAEAEPAIVDAEKQIEEAKAKLAAGEKELQDAKAKIEQQYGSVEQLQNQLEQNQEALNQVRNIVDTELEGWKKVDLGTLLEEKPDLSGLVDMIRGAIADKIQIPEDGVLTDEMLEDIRKELKNTKETVNGFAPLFEENLPEGYTLQDIVYTLIQEPLDEGQAQIDQAKSQLEELKKAEAELAAGREEIQKNEDLLNEKKQALADGEKQLQEAQAKLDQGRKALDEGKAQFAAEKEKAEAKFAAAEKKLAAGKKEIAENRAKLDAGQKALEDAAQTLADSRAKLDKAQNDLDAKIADINSDMPDGLSIFQLPAELDKAQKELDDGRAELEDGKKTFREEKSKADKDIAEAEQKIIDGKKEIADGEDKLEDARKDLAKLMKPNYLFKDRGYFQGYNEYKDNAERIGAVARVFPVIFYLIAALVSWTVMKRMVEEERINLGTYKAMGYEPRDIARKFLLYAAMSTVLGVSIGIPLGNYLLPKIIIGSYGMLYEYPPAITRFYKFDIFLTIVLSAVTTILPAVFTTRKSLQEVPAELMRPKPPKSGSKILLERWKALWSRLSFNAKVTMRNLSRYAGRNAMTAIGVAGCTVLLITGYGIGNSISGLANRQFGELLKYDAHIAYQDDADIEDIQRFTEEFLAQESVQGILNFYAENLTTIGEDINEQTVQIDALPARNHYQDYFKFYDVKSGKLLEDLPEDGEVYITHKLAKLLHVKPGDSFKLEDENGQNYLFKVSHIIESYLNHNVYMSEATYKEITGKDALVPNTAILQFSTDKQTERETLMGQINDQDSILGSSLVNAWQELFNNTLETLNAVTLILVICAAMLDFIVLYSLININVSERERELSTLKVLGAKNWEVTMYIYKEVVILVVIGILLGLIFGPLLCAYVLKTVEIDVMIFPLTINATSYLYSILLAMVFSAIVMLLMHFKIRKIDMVEAMKAVE